MRTSAPAPHALCDNLKYVARDYEKFMPQGKKGLKVLYDSYIEQLQNWNDSDSKHPKVTAIYDYLSQNDLVADLVSCGAVVLYENGYLDPKA